MLLPYLSLSFSRFTSRLLRRIVLYIILKHFYVQVATRPSSFNAISRLERKYPITIVEIFRCTNFNLLFPCCSRPPSPSSLLEIVSSLPPSSFVSLQIKGFKPKHQAEHPSPPLATKSVTIILYIFPFPRSTTQPLTLIRTIRDPTLAFGLYTNLTLFDTCGKAPDAVGIDDNCCSNPSNKCVSAISNNVHVRGNGNSSNMSKRVMVVVVSIG
mmetsp:Transcript_29645/g.44746  ORF Transcript_29645/g.44746 Transcript_29645/m.44746 type:complete len:213 (+) Transcript_29645:61-699(+)